MPAWMKIMRETASADDSVGETVMASSTGGSTVVAEAKVTRADPPPQ